MQQNLPRLVAVVALLVGGTGWSVASYLVGMRSEPAASRAEAARPVMLVGARVADLVPDAAETAPSARRRAIAPVREG